MSYEFEPTLNKGQPAGGTAPSADTGETEAGTSGTATTDTGTTAKGTTGSPPPYASNKPTIASTTPATAVRNTTTTVTVTGTKFDRSTVVVFNGVDQATTYVSATSVTFSCTTPNSAGTLPVGVRTGNLYSATTTNFVVT